MSDFSEHTNMVVGEVRGIREWMVGTHGELKSVTAWYIWKPGDQDAHCSPYLGPYSFDWILGKKRHLVAARQCACGFYAYYSKDLINQCLLTGTPLTAMFPRVVGIIEGWGRVTSGAKGFRAEHARIKALIIPGHPRAKDRTRNIGDIMDSVLYKLGFSANRIADNRQVDGLAKQIQNRYPDIPIFSNASTALKKFPLSEPLKKDQHERLQ